MASRPMAAALLVAGEWFNAALLVRLETRGWPRLSRNQSQVFPLLSSAKGTVTQSQVARALGMTRQSAHTLLHQLVALGVLRADRDPADGRQTVLSLSDQGQRLAADARAILSDLERELAARIGEAAVSALADVLAQDWGDPPTAHPAFGDQIDGE